MNTQPKQLSFQFEEWRPENWKRANQDAILKVMWEHYPPSDYEREVMAQGIRLCRFVHDLECESCAFRYEDHTVGWTYQTKVCIKDLKAKGLWPPPPDTPNPRRNELD